MSWRQTPLLWTPIIDAFPPLENCQYRRDCAGRELQVADCMEEYGWGKGREKCRTLIEDFHECVYRTKRYRRLVLMNRERERQMKSGERPEKYIETPPLDTY